MAGSVTRSCSSVWTRGGPDPWAPDEIPWTHREPTTSDLAGDVADDPDDGSDRRQPGHDARRARPRSPSSALSDRTTSREWCCERTSQVDFAWVNAEYTKRVVDDIAALDKDEAVLVEAPPGAGKSSLTVSVSKALTDADSKLRLPIVTQTNEQADDLVRSLRKKHPDVVVARLIGAVRTVDRDDAGVDLVRPSARALASNHDDHGVRRRPRRRRDSTQVGVRPLRPAAATAPSRTTKWRSSTRRTRCDPTRCWASRRMFDRLMCVGDPGQLDPFTTIDDSLWKGLEYSPSRTAMGTLARVPPRSHVRTNCRCRGDCRRSAAGIVSTAFYPFSGFGAGTIAGPALPDSRRRRRRAREDDVLDLAATAGWAYVELPEKLTVRTDTEVATQFALLVQRLLDRGAGRRRRTRHGGRPLAAEGRRGRGRAQRPGARGSLRASADRH